MTTDLYPTKTRLALLQDVLGDHCYRASTTLDPFDVNAATGRKVTAALREVEAAGWVELAPVGGQRYPRWRLTAAGHHVLSEATS